MALWAFVLSIPLSSRLGLRRPRGTELGGEPRTGRSTGGYLPGQLSVNRRHWTDVRLGGALSPGTLVVRAGKRGQASPRKGGRTRWRLPCRRRKLLYAGHQPGSTG